MQVTDKISPLHLPPKPLKTVIRKEVNLAGIRRLHNSEFWISKGFWILTILLCSGLSTYQVSMRICEYIKRPTAMKSSNVQNSTLWFPALTLCTGNINNVLDDKHNYSKIPTKYLWGKYSLKENDVSVQIPCITTKNRLCKSTSDVVEMENVFKISFNTIWGNCLTVRSGEGIRDVGSLTYLKVSFPTPNTEFKKFMFLIHSRELNEHLRHEIVYTNYLAKFKYTSHAKLVAIHYVYDDASPIDEPLAYNQSHQCYKQKFEKEMNCSLPFFHSAHMTPCNGEEEVEHNYWKAFEVYATTHCPLPHKMNHKSYSFILNEESNENDNRTAIVMNYDGNTYQLIEEKRAYNFSALMSDIGGTLGFYLGLCVLSILELFESFIYKIINRAK